MTAFDELVTKGTKQLSIKEFKEFTEQGAVILDTRNANVFTQGFVPGSINIGLEGRFAEWAGSLLPFDNTIIMITDAGKEKESVIRLARVGFDKISGCLQGGFENWKKAGRRN
jgi:rhodanese-related sulfurtransferase